jgi:hypothetical protein
MTAFANSVGRLAQHTPSHLCVRTTPTPNKYKLNNTPEWFNRRPIIPLLTNFHLHRCRFMTSEHLKHSPKLIQYP